MHVASIDAPFVMNSENLRAADRVRRDVPELSRLLRTELMKGISQTHPKLRGSDTN
mgnify:CR=1 FL=1